MSKVLEVLNRDNWIKGDLARDEYDATVNPDDVTACKFCLFGAVERAYGYEEVEPMYQRLYKHLGTAIGLWNDDPERTWEDVEKVIKELEI